MHFDKVGPLGLWNLFDDDWLGTRRAATWFFVASVVAVPTYAVTLGLVETSRLKSADHFIWSLLVIPGVLSLFFVWMGMLRYWARRDQSAKWIKRLWFVVLVGGFWYGGALYCWFAYLPQVIRSERGALRVPVRSHVVSDSPIFGRNLAVAWLVFICVVLLVFAFPKFAASVSIVPILHVASILLVLTSFACVIRWLYRQGVARK